MPAQLESGENECRVRRAAAEEILAAAEFWELPSESGVWSGDMRGLQESIRSGRRLLHVAELPTGQVIGAILTGQDGLRGYVYRLGVATERRNQGVARTLVSAALEALEQCGVKPHHIMVLLPDERVRPFWEQLRLPLRLVAHHDRSSK